MSGLIIVPVHPPDFHWTKNLLDSASSSENIAIGFSNQKDADSFHHSFPYKTLISNVADSETGFIAKKKLDLIKRELSTYQYIAMIDAESKFLRPVTICLEEMWNDNCFVANHSIDGARIMKEISKLCGYEHNDDLYPWFNSVQIFKTSLLPEFFNWLESRQEAIRAGFDFLLFAIYCRYELNMPWKVLEGKAWHGLVENGTSWEPYKHLIEKVTWSTYRKGIEQYPNIKMLFHLDRYPIQ